jgi:hypothetical protein
MPRDGSGSEGAPRISQVIKTTNRLCDGNDLGPRARLLAAVLRPVIACTFGVITL